LTEDDYTQAVSRYQEVVKENGAAVERVDVWGMRALASEIAHEKKGYFVLMEFRAQPEQLPSLKERFKLDTNVLRHRVFRLDGGR